MAPRKTAKPKRIIESYEHKKEERVNNPPVGLVTPETDPDTGQKQKTCAYDPHLDPQLQWAGKAEHKGKYRVSVHGFDYYNTKTGELESGGSERIAVWMLDTDHDGRSLYPRQVFFPMSGENEGWAKLARNLKAEVDEELIEAYRGTESLPFEAGEHRRVAVKIVDDRGIESLKVLDLP